MSIEVGQYLPENTLHLAGEHIELVDTKTLFGGKPTVLYAVPGAFTPTCSNKHLRGYVQRLGAFEERGIAVMCLAVNDAYVMQAWARSQQVPASLLMLADGNGQFTQALGLALDGTAYGMGLRARRFALYIDDGVVKALQVEAPGELRVSTAEAMLGLLSAQTL